MLVGKLVRIGGACRADTRLGRVAAVRLLNLVTLDVLPSIPGKVFDVEGCRLAFRADISYGRGTLLVHHLHA